MPSALVVGLCAVAAASFWTILGFALARRLVAPALALPIAPALGWAVHSATILPILILVGFSTTTVFIVSAATLAVSLAALFNQHAGPNSLSGLRVPAWAYLGAAALALAPALAIMPKIGIDGIAFAPPIFDHSKVALIDEMTRLGLPPGNPFFGAAGEPAPRLAYYYLWHFSAAELALLTGASGWEADIAMIWFTAFSSVTLMLALAHWFSGRALAMLWVLLLNTALSCRMEDYTRVAKNCRGYAMQDGEVTMAIWLLRAVRSVQSFFCSFASPTFTHRGGGIELLGSPRRNNPVQRREQFYTACRRF